MIQLLNQRRKVLLKLLQRPVSKANLTDFQSPELFETTISSLKPFVSDSSNCQVGGPQTVLFAYSNDLNPFIVMDTLQRSSLDSQNVSFAISRFDLPQPEDIAYFTTYK